MVPKDVWGSKLALYPFEDVELPGPENYDAFLSRFYGEYMTPPPEGNRDKHNIRKIEFLSPENGEDT
jgi:lipopolysaccharide cholinephosphotransferase